MGDITVLLGQIAAGENAARDQLFTLTYNELRRLAQIKLATESAWTQLDANSLVHEVYLRLTEGSGLSAADRHAFFGLAAAVMRNILVDHARRRRSNKRGGGLTPVTLLTDMHGGDAAAEVDVEALNAALEDLQRIDERCHNIVELRYFGGFSNEEIAETLGLSLATVKRDWQKARAFLFAALKDAPVSLEAGAESDWRRAFAAFEKLATLDPRTPEREIEDLSP